MSRRIVLVLLFGTLMMCALIAACGGGVLPAVIVDAPPTDLDAQLLEQHTGVVGDQDDGQPAIEENALVSDQESVVQYLYLYGHLPGNYLLKNEAEALGWLASEGNLWQVAPGMSIGGDRFGNREGLLPEADGRVWYECDVDDTGGYRGASRVVYSNDGLIYYTDDHYASFTRLY